MKWFTDMFSSTLGKKLVMSLTGLFLISFLVIHLIGNLQLLKSDGGQAFNVYAYFMTHNPIIKTISYTLYASILIHTAWALMLTIHNRRARGPQGYAIGGKSSAWTSRNMGILGSIIFIFIFLHLRDFWAQMHWGDLPMVLYPGHTEEVKDLYKIVAFAFTQPVYVFFYVLCMIALAFHLFHGFASAFQTLGLNHLKYNALISVVGKTFAIVVPALFALIPIWMFLF